ncbi:transposase [Streptomyces sp. BE20]|uniref:IS701 family transposase n=1 Tax=Streptomyces sp. BE20 TaxID=3002525 RepID=UPI002E7744CE|nr:transposase [Streptomyces sp. BE20]MEE1828105.1 transposase [Streptomyces sp. BE20]
MSGLALGAVGAPAHSVPLHSVPLHGVPLHSLPAHGVPVQGVPARGTAARGAPAVRELPGLDASHDVLLRELCAVLFASLPRSDQRQKGAQYLRGLLGARGRKSIRNIATVVGGQAAEQSLHHFITSSTWDWGPVRQALAQHLARIAPPQAYVLRPMVIPKAGDHSVGVDRRFIPALGQVLNAQQAVGVWAASDSFSGPLNWRLHLPQAWLDNEPRRSQALIPDEVDAETLGDCALEAVIGLPARWGLPVRPVVADARDADGMRMVRRLRAERLPMLVRVGGSFPLLPVGPVLTGLPAGPGPAHRLMSAARELRRPVVWSGPAGGLRNGLVATVPVRLPGRGARSGGRDRRGGGELLLLGVGAAGRRWPAELWLTDLVDLPTAALVRLARLTDRVGRDFARTADRVGVRDFAGRSFSGWHRHITLASAAHAVAVLARGDDRRA